MKFDQIFRIFGGCCGVSLSERSREKEREREVFFISVSLARLRNYPFRNYRMSSVIINNLEQIVKKRVDQRFNIMISLRKCRQGKYRNRKTIFFIRSENTCYGTGCGRETPCRTRFKSPMILPMARRGEHPTTSRATVFPQHKYIDMLVHILYAYLN